MAQSLISGLIVLGVIAMVHAQPQYEVQVQLPVGFEYGQDKDNQLANGSCCQSSEVVPNCNTACSETRIQLCFREQQHLKDDTNIGNCPLGMMTLMPSEGTDLITFRALVPATTTTTYPGSYQLLYRILDLSTRALLRVIDTSRIDINHEIVEREDGPLSAIASAGSNGVADLNITSGIRVICREGYFGSNCSVNCVPQNDSSGHFTCDTNGNKLCLPGYQDPETNCVDVVATSTMPTTTISTTGMTTNVPSTTSQTTPGGPGPVGTSILPIAVGCAIGGLVVLLLILIITIAIVAMVVSKSKNRRRYEKHEAVTTLNVTTSKESGAANNNASDALPMYARVQKEKKNPQEEAPPIDPYQGDIYTEVEKTGLFGGREETAMEAEYGTVAGGSRVKAEGGPPGYHNVNNGKDIAPGDEYSEIGTHSKNQPQLVYADLNVHKANTTNTIQTNNSNTYGNINTTEVEYSQIQNGQH